MRLIHRNIETETMALVSRIISGDSEAEDELVCRYSAGIRIIVDQIVRNRTTTEDISQETFRIVLEKLRHGDLREPDKLSAFVCSVARNAAVSHLRLATRYVGIEDVIDVNQIPDPGPGQFDELLAQERAIIVRQIISELRLERDRQVLFRYFVAREDKDLICQALGITKLQFNYLIYRAIARFKELLRSKMGSL